MITIQPKRPGGASYAAQRELVELAMKLAANRSRSSSGHAGSAFRSRDGNEIRCYSRANPEVAARKLIEIANSVEAVQDGRIFIELINGPMLFEHKATPAEYGAGRDYAIAKGWLQLDRSGRFVRLTQAGAEMFA
jgi:hypothetical protein